MFGCHWCHPLPFGFRPCIGVRGVSSIAGITMALRRPHKRMKMVVRWAVQRARTSGPPEAGDKPQRYNPLSPPLWIPAFAGMTIGGPD